MINLSKSNQSFDRLIRENTLYYTKPIVLVLETPFNLLHDFFVSVKNILTTNIRNKKLDAENIRLTALYLKSLDTLQENDNLKKLLNFRNNNIYNYDFLSTKIYSIVKDNVIDSFLVNIGRSDGVVEGALVIGTNNSLVGRVVNVMDNYSSILMLNDSNSKIPARTIESKERIIISGEGNSELLRIIFFNSKKPNIISGEKVYTSGDSNLIPDGIFIGEVIERDEEFFIKMNENPYNVFDVLIIIPKIIKHQNTDNNNSIGQIESNSY